MSNKAFANILAAVNKMSTKGGSQSAEGFWKADTDKAGNGFAIIRFLPGKTDDDIPMVKIFNHGFKNAGGKWFIENCPTTLGQECPVCGANSELWNTGRESSKKIASERKRKTSYISNILVISDPKNPANEGKVFKFKYGVKVFEKIKYRMQPPAEFPDEVPMNVFDLKEGANFKMKIRKVDSFANFDLSEFESPTPVPDAENIMSQLHDIHAEVDPSLFKSFDDLERKFKTFIGEPVAAAPRRPEPDKNDSDDEIDDGGPPPSKAKTVTKEAPPSDDDDLDYFKKLANE